MTGARRGRLAVMAITLAAGLPGCGAGAGDGVGVAETSIVVFAAASLTDAFGELATAFEAANPGVTVEINVGGSSALREQILAGAPGAVFASASPTTMDAVVEAGIAVDPVAFAVNGLQIVVPAGNPGGVAGLADFADAALLLGLCAEQVPCGEYSRQALAKAAVTPSIDTNEADARSLLTKVEVGELDAGIVYRSDVLAAGDAVEGIDIPAGANVTALYQIATLDRGSTAEAALAFVDFALSGEGRTILTSLGFAVP